MKRKRKRAVGGSRRGWGAKKSCSIARSQLRLHLRKHRLTLQLDAARCKGCWHVVVPVLHSCSNPLPTRGSGFAHLVPLLDGLTPVLYHEVQVWVLFARIIETCPVPPPTSTMVEPCASSFQSKPTERVMLSDYSANGLFTLRNVAFRDKRFRTLHGEPKPAKSESLLGAIHPCPEVVLRLVDNGHHGFCWFIRCCRRRVRERVRGVWGGLEEDVQCTLDIRKDTVGVVVPAFWAASGATLLSFVARCVRRKEAY